MAVNSRSALPGAYNDLEYANYTPVVQQRPVKELTDLYKKKGEDYIYVATAMNELDRAISNTPHLEERRQDVLDIKGDITNAFDEYEQTGDFENRVLDVNKLVSNTSKKLLPIQQEKQRWDSYMQGLMEKDKDGNLIHSMDDIKKAAYMSKKGIEPLVWDDELGTYTGGFQSGVSAPSKINFSERVADILNDWKANKITLVDKNGNPLTRLGNGYLKAGSVEYTDDSELINAAKSYLVNDPDFKDRVDFDLRYELETLLGEEDGTMRQMSLNDVQQRFTGDLKNVTSQLGLTGDASLEDQLKNNNITPEQLYKTIRIEQLTNSAIKLGVSKESYKQYEDKYLKDELLLKAIEWQNENRKKGDLPILDETYSSIDKILSYNKINEADYNNIKSGMDIPNTTLLEHKKILNDYKQGRIQLSPTELDELNRRIENDTKSLRTAERQLETIKSHIENKSDFNFDVYYKDYVDNLNAEKQTRLRNKLQALPENRGTNRDYRIYTGEIEVPASVKNEVNTKVNTLIAEIEEEMPTLSPSDFNTEVIENFVNKNYYGILTEGNPRSSTKYVAEKLKEAYGGEFDSQPIQSNYYTIRTEGIKNSFANNFIKSKKNSLVDAPETFVFKDRNLPTILKEDYDVDWEDVDASKFDMNFVTEPVNEKPAYVINTRLKDKEGVDIKVTVNHDGDILGDNPAVRKFAITEGFNRFKDKDILDLDMQDETLFNQLGYSYINSHPMGKDFDELGLEVAQPGIPIVMDMENYGGGSMMFVPSKKNLEGGDDYKNLKWQMVFNNELIFGSKDGRIGWYPLNDKTIIPEEFPNTSKLKQTLGTGFLYNEIEAIKEQDNANPYLQFLEY